MSIGFTELSIIFYLILPFLLRKRYPLRPKLGAILGIFNPLGQFYVENNAMWYFLGLLAFGVAVQFFILPEVNMLFLTAIPGAILNVYRIMQENRKQRKRTGSRSATHNR